MGSTNFPIKLTSCIGREQEIVDVTRLLARSRLVTLTGAGGSGKTRLAFEIAAEVQDEYPDGVWLVELTSLHDPAHISQLVALALGLHTAPNQTVFETLVGFLRSKHLLIVLDNCEHLSRACAELALQLLSHAVDLRILATSRSPLAMAGEAVYPISGLDWPGSEDPGRGKIPGELDPQTMMSFGAIRLLVERASACAPGFELTAATTPYAVEICRRLDGLPLALELASAHANVLTIQEIAERLKNCFELLSSGQLPGSHPRHHTLRATIDWSHQLLTKEEQVLLRRLAVFEAGCSLEAAEAVCADDELAATDILDGISSLVGKSLVVAETHDRIRGQYRLLETIRTYALEKLGQSGEAERIRNRHLDYFLAQSEEAEPNLNREYQQLWLNQLESEHGNLRAALSWSLESSRIEAGLRIATAITRFWEIRGYVREGLTWFERLLPLVDETVPAFVHAHALARASFLSMFLGDGPATLAYGRKAVALAEAGSDDGREVLGIALASLTTGARTAGDYSEAFNLGTRTIQLLREANEDPFLLGMALLEHAGVALELGQFETALAELEECLAIAEQAGDPFRIAHALNSIGDLARREGRFADARTSYERSASLMLEVGAQHDLASVLCNLGHTYAHLGDSERAIALFTESLVTHQEMHNVPGMAEGLIGFAGIAIEQDMPAEGARLLGAAMASSGQRTAATSVWQATRMEYEHYLDLARVKLTEEEFQSAQKVGKAMSLEQAVDYAQNLPLKPEITPASREMPDGLTGREREVAALIGQGKTNGEIANELVLSKRTVESHVSKILSKLGLTSRGQIMRWAIDHGLTQTPA